MCICYWHRIQHKVMLHTEQDVVQMFEQDVELKLQIAVGAQPWRGRIIQGLKQCRFSAEGDEQMGGVGVTGKPECSSGKSRPEPEVEKSNDSSDDESFTDETEDESILKDGAEWEKCYTEVGSDIENKAVRDPIEGEEMDCDGGEGYFHPFIKCLNREQHEFGEGEKVTLKEEMMGLFGRAVLISKAGLF